MSCFAIMKASRDEINHTPIVDGQLLIETDHHNPLDLSRYNKIYMDNNINNIPVEKLRFVQKNDLYHDSKFETKPVSYFQGAFKRFCKNKGSVVGGIVIACLVLFALCLLKLASGGFAPFIYAQF